MIDILEAISNLFKPDETETKDESWPNAAEPKYYEEPNTGDTYQSPIDTTEFRPSDDEILPGYRGTEQHGVSYDPSINYVIPIPQDQIPVKETPDNIDVEPEILIEPIAVTVVDMPSPIGRQSKIATAQWTVIRSASAVRIAPKRQQREKLILAVSGNDMLMIGSDAQAIVSQGFGLVVGMGNVELNTTEALYAYAPAGAGADIPVYVMEEFGVTIDEHPV